jgi:hypothetical protein
MLLSFVRANSMVPKAIGITNAPKVLFLYFHSTRR